MKRILAIATFVIIGVAAQPSALTLGQRFVEPDSGYLAAAAVQNTGLQWNGQWQGMTAAGSQLLLQLQLQGDRLSGRLTVGKQSAKIVYGKVVGEAFALTTDPIDGHSVDATGRQLGDAIELTIEGVADPLTLTRVK